MLLVVLPLQLLQLEHPWLSLQQSRETLLSLVLPQQMVQQQHLEVMAPLLILTHGLLLEEVPLQQLVWQLEIMLSLLQMRLVVRLLPLLLSLLPL